MRANPEEELKQIERRMMIVSIADAPGAIMVGLGMYAKFAANGDAFLPILNNDQVVNVMLTIGGLIMIWGAFEMVRLGRRKAEIDRKRAD